MLNACTIIACNYLPFAKVLTDSFLAYHPDGRFTVLLVDDEWKAFSPGTAIDDRISWLRLADIGLDTVEIARLAGIYDVTELATSVKPLLLRHLLNRGARAAIYLDPDIRVYDSLEPVADLVATHGIVLTPHTMTPYPRDDRQVDGYFVLSAGVYNLGFIAVSAAAGAFLDWWWHVTRREALADLSQQMFTDQRWIDFVPSFYDHFILKDPGYNVAYWNLHGRELTRVGGRYLVDGVALRFFHFSGFDTARPGLLSSHQGDRPRVLLEDRPVLAELCQEYLAAVQRAGPDPLDRLRYGWSRSASGLNLTTRMRRLYRTALIESEAQRGPQPPDPFDAANPNAFVDWLNASPVAGPGHLSRFLFSIYRDRLDLQIQFPDLNGGDADRLSDWIWRDSDLRENIPLELMPRSRPDTRNVAARQNEGVAEDGSGIAPLESMLPHLDAMTTLREGAPGPLGSLRRFAQRVLFRVLRPYAFQQYQLHRQLIGALRQVTVALRRQEHLHDSLEARVREMTAVLLEAKREIRSLEAQSLKKEPIEPRR